MQWHAAVEQHDRLVVGVEAGSGKFLWGYNPVANATANIPTPLVRDDYIFCSTGYGTGAALLELKPVDGGGVRHIAFFAGASSVGGQCRHPVAGTDGRQPAGGI